jgi:hypothetical protein
MARSVSSSLAAAAGAALLAGGVWLARRTEAPSAEPPAALSPAPPSATTTQAPATRDEREPRPDLESADPPALARYREEIAFGDAVRAFFDGYRELDESEREARAEELLGQIDARERDGRILPQEALMLRLGILRATVDDPAVLDSESRQLVEDYRARAEQAAANRVPDPRDEQYQTRQAEIAREVMALEEIPGGVPREEYLRERLRELRLEVYANGQPASE